ncbi:hypothetical protein CRG98_040944 [Punica granatum]|uniref:Uncharacterized protein n=1 Tax=Punica granatum TaxID=22663 RepID=A0A2I0I3W2_PUNGR|nr:hypothetical protein CRG98_040944 [Punica granatum]
MWVRRKPNCDHMSVMDMNLLTLSHKMSRRKMSHQSYDHNVRLKRYLPDCYVYYHDHHDWRIDKLGFERLCLGWGLLESLLLVEKFGMEIPRRVAKIQDLIYSLAWHQFESRVQRDSSELRKGKDGVGRDAGPALKSSSTTPKMRLRIVRLGDGVGGRR